jgi:hypothetical protein
MRQYTSNNFTPQLQGEAFAFNFAITNLTFRANASPLQKSCFFPGNNKRGMKTRSQATLTLSANCFNTKISVNEPDFSRHVEKSTLDLTPQPHREQGQGENSKPLSCQERGLERGFPDPVKSQQ